MESIVGFQSPGIIDYRCITTIGASVKEGDNPIGFFGTGLKYAIAIILRSGGTVDIYRGMERLSFTAKAVSIRGKDFSLVCMNGKEMGFTTDLGKQWKMWQAFREIWCNTVDEKGTMGVIRPCPGKTTVVVNSPEFAECAKEVDKYILRTKPLQSTAKVEFHEKSGDKLYYRTILVQDSTPKHYKFTPNIKGELKLTEDRTLYSVYDAQMHIGAAIHECTDLAFVEDWLTAGEDYMEHDIDIFWWNTAINPLIVDLGRKLYKDPLTYNRLNRSMLNYLRARQGEPDHVAVLMLAPETEELQAAIAFCNQLGYTVDEYPIVVTETLGESVLGLAHIKTKKIFIARTAVAQGKLCLVATLIEEWCHIKHQHHDCSRGMQNWLFENIVRLGAAYLHCKAQDRGVA